MEAVERKTDALDAPTRVGFSAGRPTGAPTRHHQPAPARCLPSGGHRVPGVCERQSLGIRRRAREEAVVDVLDGIRMLRRGGKLLGQVHPWTAAVPTLEISHPLVAATPALSWFQKHPRKTAAPFPPEAQVENRSSGRDVPFRTHPILLEAPQGHQQGMRRHQATPRASNPQKLPSHEAYVRSRRRGRVHVIGQSDQT